jgi:Fur family ferric uptake transcriptional regulator
MHRVCKACGKFFHLEGPALKMLQLSVQRISGFVLDQQQSVLLGLCAACSGRPKVPAVMRLGRRG